MPQIRIKLDLSLEQALRIAAAMTDDVHECEESARYFDEHEKAAYAAFYRVLADKSRMIKDILDRQIRNAKNIYIGGDENESARA